jgi:hypothetical protein
MAAALAVLDLPQLSGRNAAPKGGWYDRSDRGDTPASGTRTLRSRMRLGAALVRPYAVGIHQQARGQILMPSRPQRRHRHI